MGESRYSTYRRLGHEIKDNIEPFWKKCSTSLSQVQTADATEFDAEALQEDRKDVGHQYDEQELILV